MLKCFLCTVLYRNSPPPSFFLLVIDEVVHDLWSLLFSGAGAEKLLKFKKWFWSIVEKMSNSDRQDLVSVLIKAILLNFGFGCFGNYILKTLFEVYEIASDRFPLISASSYFFTHKKPVSRVIP